MNFLHIQLLSFRRPTLRATDSVAARIQRLQNAAELEPSATPSRLPRVMTRAQVSGTTVGRGRRIDNSFGSPAGHASRDGNEGLRGDGRPPVGDFRPTIHSSIEKEVVLRPTQLSVQRPATSFDMDDGSNSASTETAPINALQPLRKHRSLQNLRQPKSADNEIFQARTRLRSVKQPTSPRSASLERRNVWFDAPGHRNKPSQDSKANHKILNELDTLLVGALEGVNTTTGQANGEHADNTALTSSAGQSSTPQSLSRPHSRPRDSSTARQIRPQSTSCHRKYNTEDSVVPESSADTDLADCFKLPSDSRSAEQASNEEQGPLSVATSLRSCPSPVKARVAVFEKMKFHIPGEHVHDRHNWEDSITTSGVMSIRQKLEKKDSRPPPANIPPIELALPRLISHPRRDSQRSSRSVHLGSCQYETAEQSAAMSPPIVEPTKDRKISIPWPFKWNLFPHDKGTPAPPQPSAVEAKAETGHEEHVVDSSVEHSTNHIHISPAKSALRSMSIPSLKSEDPTGQVVVGSSSLQDKPKPLMEDRIRKNSETRQLEEYQKDTDPEKSQTPKKRTDPISAQLTTPSKPGTPRLKSSTTTSSPRTPFRGRARSDRRENYPVEQRYSLSRSRSRGGIKIQLEVRSPDRSPERANDDTIVIIRANVEPMDG